MFELEVQLTKEIYGKVSSAIVVRKFLYVYLTIALLSLVILLDLIMIPPATLNWRDWIFPTLFVLAIVAFPILQFRFGFGWKSYPTAAQTAKYILSEDGLNVNGETYHAFQAWTNFLGIKQMRAAVVLFFTQNQIFIFPNTSFSSPQQRSEIVEFMRRHIPASRQRSLRFPTVKRFAILFGVWLAIIVGVFIVLTISRR